MSKVVKKGNNIIRVLNPALNQNLTNLKDCLIPGAVI